MVFFQLTINATDPARRAAFWAHALGYVPTPPTGDTTWWQHYRDGLGDHAAYDDRLHLDVYVTGRDDTMPYAARVERVEAAVADLVQHGARVERRNGEDDPDDPYYWVVMHDPEGNEFCVS